MLYYDEYKTKIEEKTVVINNAKIKSSHSLCTLGKLNLTTILPASNHMDLYLDFILLLCVYFNKFFHKENKGKNGYLKIK